jgi:hypothetical protein
VVVDYDKVSVIVFVNNEHEIRTYLNLFRVMLEGKAISTTRSNGYGRIQTDKFDIKFHIKSDNKRGCRAHYVLNLTQDLEFEKMIAVPATNIRNYLDGEKWAELFK